MPCGTNVYALRVLGSRQAQFVTSSDKECTIADTSTVIVQCKVRFIDTIHIALKYAPAFEENYWVRFNNVCIMNIEEDMMSSASLSANSGATYIC